MESSTTNQITTLGNQNFFLSPQFPMQRQYEALRAYLVEDEPSADVARRFGYSPGAFRVLCYQFRHDPQKRASFFRQPQRGPQSSPARDRVRELAVAMRKRNLSVYDMQRELAAAGHTISINSLTVLLREEGFSRLPRRADGERPPIVKPEIAEVADVRHLDLSPRSFRTPVAGLLLFVPLLDSIDLLSVVTAARLPGTKMIPAAQAVAAPLLFRSGLSQCACQLRRGTPGKALCFQPQPLAEGHSGLLGARRRTGRLALCQCRSHQRRADRRDSPVRTLLEEAYRQAARRAGLRLATDHLREALGVESGRDFLHHSA